MSETNQAAGPDTSKWTVTVDGDANHGWIVGVHDGDNQASYSPTADGALDAREAAIQAHVARFHAP
jgi:hypothetical protein